MGSGELAQQRVIVALDVPDKKVPSPLWIDLRMLLSSK